MRQILISIIFFVCLSIFIPIKVNAVGPYCSAEGQACTADSDCCSNQCNFNGGLGFSICGNGTPPTPTPPPAPGPIGSFDGVDDATCSVNGWAFDQANPSNEITVHIYDGATIIGGYNTGVPRPDVNAFYGISGNHGFNAVLPLADGNTHTIYIYAIGQNSNAVLAGVPKNITCPLNVAPTAHTLTGRIYVDPGNNTCSALYGGTGTVTAYTSGTPGSSSPISGGAYSISSTSGDSAVLSGVPPGYTVEKVNPGSGFVNYASFTYSPISFASNSTLDWCIASSTPWWKTGTGDVRYGTLSNPLPTGQTAGSNPACFFSSTGAASFGAGVTPSCIINNEYSYNNDPNTRSGALSYTFFTNRALVKQVNVTPVTPSTPGFSCTGNSCDIANLPTGIYRYNGDLVVTSYAQAPGAHVLLLVNGNLTFNLPTNGGIKVPLGAGNLLIMAAHKDINILSTVGQSAPVGACTDSTCTTLEGIYTAEGSINLQSKMNGCSDGATADNQFNLAGSFITNSIKPFKTGGSGVFNNKRSLCTNDAIYPSFTTQTRYDFVTQMTDFYKTPSVRFREVNP